MHPTPDLAGSPRFMRGLLSFLLTAPPHPHADELTRMQIDGLAA